MFNGGNDICHLLSTSDEEDIDVSAVGSVIVAMNDMGGLAPPNLLPLQNLDPLPNLVDDIDLEIDTLSPDQAEVMKVLMSRTWTGMHGLENTLP
jgi:hypothetical protein